MKCKYNPLKQRSLIVMLLSNKLGWGAATIGKWLESDNMNFGIRSPESLIKSGEGDVVVHFITAIIQRN